MKDSSMNAWQENNVSDFDNRENWKQLFHILNSERKEEKVWLLVITMTLTE